MLIVAGNQCPVFNSPCREISIELHCCYNYVGDVLQALKINPFPYIPINSLTHTFMQCQLSIFHLDVQYELELFRELQDIDKDFFW